MPIPKQVAHWNKAGLNRVVRRIAPWDWLRNIQAAAGGELRTRGLVFQVSEPRVYHDEVRAGIRPAERQMLRLLGVADFVHLKAVLRQSS